AMRMPPTTSLRRSCSAPSSTSPGSAATSRGGAGSSVSRPIWRSPPSAITRHRATPFDQAGALDEDDQDLASSDPAWRLAERDLVRPALIPLSPKRRAELVFSEVNGLTTAEVGRALGMSGVVMRAALHRGRSSSATALCE